MDRTGFGIYQERIEKMASIASSDKCFRDVALPPKFPKRGNGRRPHLCQRVAQLIDTRQSHYIGDSGDKDWARGSGLVSVGSAVVLGLAVNKSEGRRQEKGEVHLKRLTGDS